MNNVGVFTLRAKTNSDGSFRKYSGMTVTVANNVTGGPDRYENVNISMSQLQGALILKGMTPEEASRFGGGAWQWYWEVVSRDGDLNSSMIFKQQDALENARMDAYRRSMSTSSTSSSRSSSSSKSSSSSRSSESSRQHSSHRTSSRSVYVEDDDESSKEEENAIIQDIQDIKFSMTNMKLNISYLDDLAAVVESATERGFSRIADAARSVYYDGVEICRTLAPSDPEVKKAVRKAEELKIKEKQEKKKDLIVCICLIIFLIFMFYVCDSHGFKD